MAEETRILATLDALCVRLAQLERNALMGAKDVLNLQEAAAYSGLSEGHVRRLTAAREIPYYKQGKYLYFRKRELADWLTAHPVKTREQVNREAEAYVRRKGVAYAIPKRGQ